MSSVRGYQSFCVSTQVSFRGLHVLCSQADFGSLTIHGNRVTDLTRRTFGYLLVFFLLRFPFVLDQSYLPSDELDFVPRLFLHQIETHGAKRETEQQVQSDEHELLLRVPVVYGRPGHVVPEPDGGESDKAEVVADEKRPILPQTEHESARRDVACRQHRADRQMVYFLGAEKRNLHAFTCLQKVLPHIVFRLLFANQRASRR